MRDKPFPYGHLFRNGNLVLKQTDKTREVLSKKNKARYAFDRLKPVVVDWKSKQ